MNRKEPGPPLVTPCRVRKGINNHPIINFHDTIAPLSSVVCRLQKHPYHQLTVNYLFSQQLQSVSQLPLLRRQVVLFRYLPRAHVSSSIQYPNEGDFFFPLSKYKDRITHRVPLHGKLKYRSGQLTAAGTLQDRTLIASRFCLTCQQEWEVLPIRKSHAWVRTHHIPEQSHRLMPLKHLDVSFFEMPPGNTHTFILTKLSQH